MCAPWNDYTFAWNDCNQISFKEKKVNFRFSRMLVEREFLFNLELCSTMDKLKLIWSEFLLLKMFPEWLWPLSSLSEGPISRAIESLKAEVNLPSQGTVLNKNSHFLLQGLKQSVED